MATQGGTRARSGVGYLLLMAAVYGAARVGAALFFFFAIEPGPALEGWNRMANAWTVPAESQAALLRSFLARAKEDHDRSGRRDAVLVAGDSQFYGYYLPAPRTMAARLAEELPGTSVYNASRLSGSYAWSQAALESAIAEGLTPRVLVVNANPATLGDTGPAGGSVAFPRSLLASLLFADETWARAVEVFRARLRAAAPPFDPYDRRPVAPGDGTYQLTALARDYYPPAMPRFASQSLRALLDASRGKVELIVVVASPHHYAPYNEAPFRYGWDTAPSVREAMAICAEYAHAACLDLSTAFGRESFHDVVHLNEAGHRRLAAEIAAAIRSRLGAGGPVSR